MKKISYEAKIEFSWQVAESAHAKLIGFAHIIVNVGLNFWLRNQNTQQG